MNGRFLVGCFLIAACSQPNEKTGDPVAINNTVQNDAGEDSTVPNDDSGSTMLTDFEEVTESGPQFVSLTVSPGSLTENSSVTISALMTDVDGFDDIGGGQLLDDEGNDYGVFVGSGGSYEKTISWDELNAVRPSTFDTGLTMTFVASFFDLAGDVGKKSIALELTCDGDSACDGACGSTLCDGECVAEFDTDENCGSCGRMCAEGTVCNNNDCESTTFLWDCSGSPDICTGETSCQDPFGPGNVCIQNCGNSDDCLGAECVELGGRFCALNCDGQPSICEGGTVCRPDGDGGAYCVPQFD